MINKIKPIAIFLPQFHPIPENDEWWGKGFTEWTNVTKAKPLFKEHYQPHLPADLGFYDLRLEQSRMAQEEFAKKYNIYGFCYYHYWFNGKRILNQPIESKMSDTKQDLPFMLCWANENWTRTWDGNDKKILLEQNYSESDDRKHINELIRYFKDDRYIKIEGKPVVAIYRSTLLPDAQKTINIWREEARKQNMELFICRFENFHSCGEDYLKSGFDFGIDFQPFGNYMDDFQTKKYKQIKRNIYLNIKRKIKRSISKLISKDFYEQVISKEKRIFDYNEYVDFAIRNSSDYNKCFPGITPGWDNTARKKSNYFLFKNSNPEAYGKWLKHIVTLINKENIQNKFIFINAWNEWAEGNHLEPCQKWGTAFLEKTRESIEG